MTSTIYFDDEHNYGPARVCIIGRPGTGKTSLAGTFPNPYIQSIENGAGAIRALRNEIAPNDGAFDELKREIDALARCPFDKNLGGLLVKRKNSAGVEKEFLVKTLVIDSMDAIQQSKRFAILGSRTSFEQRDWGKLFDLIMPVALKWNALPIHVVVIAHVKQDEPDEERLGHKSFSLQGAFRDHFPRWFRYVLHLEASQGDQRVMYTRPTVVNKYQIEAKDTYRVFANQANPMVVKHTNGIPTSDIADAICDLHRLDGSVPAPERDQVASKPATTKAPQAEAAKNDASAFWTAWRGSGKSKDDGQAFLAKHNGDFDAALKAMHQTAEVPA